MESAEERARDAVTHGGTGIGPTGRIDRAALELAAWQQVARRALVEYTRYTAPGEGTPADGQRQPEAWWAEKLAVALGGLLDAVETEPATVAQLMSFVQRERRGGRHVNLATLGRLFGAEAVDHAVRRGWLLDHGDGRVAPSAGWLDLHRERTAPRARRGIAGKE